MSKIMFCATPEGMARQVQEMKAQDGFSPRLLRGEKDVLEAILALEMGISVIADARTATTGLPLPEGVEIGFDADMMGAGMRDIRDQCAAQANRFAPVSGLQRVPLQTTPSEGLVTFLNYHVQDPFGAHEPAFASPEAA